MTEPYRLQNGETWGDEMAKVILPPKLPARLNLVLRARRARTDPNWKTRTEASKRLLLALDAKERGDLP